MLIHQIFYNDETEKLLAEPFIPLNNKENLRPDLAEYWPIKQFFQKNKILNEDEYYGFFSPKFELKTGLSAEVAIKFFSENLNKNYDVIGISPGWPYIGLFKNCFIQAEAFHPGALSLSQRLFDNLLNQNIDLNKMVGHSQNTVLCNYFIAKPKFWRRWLSIADVIYEVSQNPQHELYLSTNGTANYGDFKQFIFILERLVNWLVLTEPWTIKCFDTFLLNPMWAGIEDCKHQTMACDALKQSYSATNYVGYLDAFEILKHDVFVKKGYC